MKTFTNVVRSAAILGGQVNWVRVPIPTSDCLISRLILNQVGGTPCAVKAQIFESQRFMIDGSQSSGGADHDGAYSPSPATFSICSELTGADGELAKYFNESGGQLPTFSSQEIIDPNRTRVRGREAFVKITSLGPAAEPQTWDVAISGLSDLYA